MLDIQYLSCTQGEWEPGGIPVVHPYYWTTFSVLHGAESPAQYWAADNTQFLLDPIGRASAACREQLTDFLDVRTTEEYGAPAPEYLLLDRAGLNHLSPLAIRGMESLALPQALEIAQVQLQQNGSRKVLLCCSALPTPYDGTQSRERRAAAFVVDLYAPSRSSQIRIVEHRCGVTPAQLEEKLRRFEGEIIYSEVSGLPKAVQSAQVICGRDGMLAPLFLLEQLRSAGHRMEMLVLLESGGHYGYVHYQMGRIL